MSRPPATQYSISLRVTLDNVPGVLGRLATAIGEAGGNIFAVDAFVAKGSVVERDIVVNCRSVEHQNDVVEAVRNTPGITLHDWWDRTFRMHEGGKIEVLPLCPVGDQEDLSMAYTPGVARVCTAIANDESLADEYTIRKNTVAIVSDGTAVLGLGDIGPKGAMPVMEGKALLFKEFGGVDAFPICLDVSTPEQIIETVVRLAPTFGGINLEDIAAPGAFQVEEALKQLLDIPVFHDDQHGTAVVTLAALQNALRITGKRISDLSIVISGVGAAGVAIGKILLGAGATQIVGVDSKGAVYDGREGLNQWKQWFAEHTNPDGKQGSLGDVIAGCRRVHRGQRPRRPHRRRRTGDGRRPDRVRDGQPRSRDPARTGRRSRAGDGHRAQRLPEPDQQRAGLPGHLPRRARRQGNRHHREHETRCRQGDRRVGHRRATVRDVHHAPGVRQVGLAARRRRRRSRRRGRRRLPPVT